MSDPSVSPADTIRRDKCYASGAGSKWCALPYGHTGPHDFAASIDVYRELLAVGERDRRLIDCGGVNCGACQQCLTVNQWALQLTVDALKAEGERDKAELAAFRKALADVGLHETATVDDLIRHHRGNAALAAGADAFADRERDRRQIARLTEALRFYADKSKWNYRIGGKQPRATYVSYRLAEEALRDVAVLAGEEDAGDE